MTKILIRVVGKYLIRECIIKDGLFLFLKELSAFKEEYPNIQHLENVICTLKKNFLLKIYPNLLEAINLKEVVLKINIHSPFKLPLFDEIHLQFNDFSYADLILTKNDTYEISNFTIDNRTDDKLSVIDTMNKIDNFTKILGIIMINKYTDTNHFRQMFYELKQNVQYIGKDDEGINQYDPDISLPTLKLTGTVKVHGANAGITYNVTKGKVYPQSRENVIEGGGLYGFANYYENNKTFFIDLLKSYLPITGNIDMITLFGEWAGKGIQKGVAVSKLEKTFFLFGIKVKNTNDDTYWLDISNIEHRGDINFYNLSKIKRYDIEFDFNNPDKHLEVITELTNEVETQCPVGTFFGIDGIGEGIVWETYHNNKKYRFKSKGDKHKVSKSKTVSIEPEKQESIDAFFKYAVTENRLQQGLQKIFFDHDKPLDVKGTGDFVKWVTSDILKEESDTMTASNLEWNDIKSVISKYCAKWFMGKVYE